MDHLVKKFQECSAATTVHSERPHLFPYFPRDSLPSEMGPNDATLDFPSKQSRDRNENSSTPSNDYMKHFVEACESTSLKCYPVNSASTVFTAHPVENFVIWIWR